MYQRLMKSAPPGVAGFNWMESMASLTQGRAAMWIDADGWAPPIEDPNASRVVGKIGSILGEAGVNIAAMQVARRSAGGEALMALTVDSSVDAELLSEVAAAIGSTRGSIVDLRTE